MMELRNGVHKYELNLQAGGSITGKIAESTHFSRYFRNMCAYSTWRKSRLQNHRGCVTGICR